MNREVHVRFWEGLRVRFPRATHFVQPSAFRTLSVDWGCLASAAAGRLGLRTNSPPQFGHVLLSLFSTHPAQNVHSKVQIRASRLSLGRSRSQHSQLGRRLSILNLSFFRSLISDTAP